MRRLSALLAVLPFAVAACAGAEAARTPAPTCPTVAAPIASASGGENSGGSAAAHPNPPKHARSSDEVAKEVVGSINDKNPNRLFALLDSDMRAVLPLPEAGALVQQVRESKGAIVSSTREADTKSGAAVYRFKAERGEWVLELTIGTDGRIAGMNITNPAPRDPEVAVSALPMELPFRGQWLVVWGGGSPSTNGAHLLHKSQRRAADLVKVDGQGKTHSGDGKKNADYFAYGQDVLAAAAGTVIFVIDGVPENEPGTMNPYFAYGNTVVMRHDDKTYSAYAHLMPGKTRVRPGTKVTAGEILGLVGNSGNASEPHLHFQVQDGPLLDRSFGVEPTFAKVPVVRGGTAFLRATYTWSKDDLVGALQNR